MGGGGRLGRFHKWVGWEGGVGGNASEDPANLLRHRLRGHFVWFMNDWREGKARSGELDISRDYGTCTFVRKL